MIVNQIGELPVYAGVLDVIGFGECFSVDAENTPAMAKHNFGLIRLNFNIPNLVTGNVPIKLNGYLCAVDTR